MFRQITMLLASGALSATAAARAAGEEPEVLQRTGKWVLDYDTDSCNLLAQFGTGDAATTIKFSRFEPGDEFDLSIYGDRLGLERHVEEAGIDFGLGSGPFEETPMYGTAGTMKVVLLNGVRLDGYSRILKRDEFVDDAKPKITPEQEARVTGLTYATKHGRPLRLEFGSLAKPLLQMRDCTANLVRRWGYDPGVQAALKRAVTPATSPMKWLSDDDYPIDAIKKGLSGIVQFRLDVDAAGKVVGCTVLARTDPDAFADLTCKTLRARARFLPALDAQGRPVRSYFVSKVTFRIPR